MKKRYEDLIDELDPNQKSAARVSGNAVIAAGAGSGKTRVLAARYLYLVIERELPVDEIVALTFTRKAAAEMFSRIYATLRDTDHPLAEEAVAAFHLARIDTIDAFCNSIARAACRNYGIAPDFRIDSDGARDLARELALPFFLERRRSPAIQQLMKRYSLAELPERFLADSMLRYSTVSSPLDFPRYLETQKREIAERFASLTRSIAEAMARLSSLGGAGGKTGKLVGEALAAIPDAPDIGDARGIAAFIDGCDRLAAVSLPGRVTDPALAELKEILADFKKTQYPRFLSVANYALNEPFVEESFALLAEFQGLFNRKKREAGILTFPDVSRLALDALIADPELRSAYKASTGAVMIDEFQDDNAMQRDLLYLIAERPERREKSVPTADELCPDKLFFVGDEKQSIYRFRGADVSVFRELARDLAPKKEATASGDRARAIPELSVNYRTERGLIDSFNRLFPSVFLNPAYFEGGTIPLYEAGFAPIKAARETEGVESALEILIVNKDAFAPDNPAYLSPSETEAREVARRIRALIEGRVPVRDGDATRPCAAEDIAILFRSGTRQHLYEKCLREEGIPSRSETLRGLFSDAPINDLYALLRIAVYPADTTAYAMVLRSPFVRVGDCGFASCLLDRVPADGDESVGEPFSASAESLLDPGDADRFRRGRALYEAVRGMADRVPTAEILTYLWYDEGYRYALLSEPRLHRYAELYDYFFELARAADARGETLATFLDAIQNLMLTGEKIEGLDIPAERSGGVTLMTIHKSKGLEFPIVFLVDAGSEGQGSRNDDPVYFSADAGLSINTGGAEEAESASANWFYEKGREGERKREEAEARRLLYVAMTRAETRLYVSGIIPCGDEGEGKPRQNGEMAPIIAAILEKKDKNASAKGQTVAKRSLFDFLLPALGAGTIPGVAVTEILPEIRGQSSKESLRAGFTATDVAPRYAATPEARYEPAPRAKFSATELHALGDRAQTADTPETLPNTPKAAQAEFDFAEGADEPIGDGAESETAQKARPPARIAPSDSAPPDRLDLLLAKTETSAADFGTFAHRAIEARFTGLAPFIPDELRPAAEGMADRFFASELGKKAMRATWRESESGFITRYAFAGRELTVTGQMDLVFEADGIAYVVDYKTDRVEDASIHAEQLAVYRKAARDLRKKPVETWLYYLRSGRPVRIDD